MRAPASDMEQTKKSTLTTANEKLKTMRAMLAAKLIKPLMKTKEIASKMLRKEEQRR